MLDFPRWKIWAVIAALVLGVALAVPNFFPEAATKTWPSFLPRERVPLGLDLRGGSHLLLQADTGDVAKQRLATMEESVRTEMRRAVPRIEVGDISTADGVVSFLVRDVRQIDAAVEKTRGLSQPVGVTGQRDWDVAVRDSTRVVMTPSRAGLDKAVDEALDTAREVVARRIDPNGTSEATVLRQGDDRILVQVPGLQDSRGLRALLGKTAKLEFKLVDLNANPQEVAAGRAPAGSQVLPYPDSPDGGGRIAVKRQVMVSGDELVDAQQGFDQTNNAAVVNIRFDGQGGRRFARVTQENVQKPFAIILDNVVLSAPNINEPILGGSAQISGNFTPETANDLAISLRSGKLPVTLTTVEERTIGPDLGAESIERGVIACLIGGGLVMLYLFATYGLFGLFANIALLLNVVIILGIMSVAGATLTLPGIAGLVLTIGAAVDANVLINERIREEIRRGRRLLDALSHGFKEASTAIFDANTTNVIAAVLMYALGSGPIRGFAVVLMIGIVTSYFTAVVVTRLMVMTWFRRTRPTALPI